MDNNNQNLSPKQLKKIINQNIKDTIVRSIKNEIKKLQFMVIRNRFYIIPQEVIKVIDLAINNIEDEEINEIINTSIKHPILMAKTITINNSPFYLQFDVLKIIDNIINEYERKINFN